MQPGLPARTDPRWKALLTRLCERSVLELDVAHASVVIGTGRRDWVPGAATSESAGRLEEFAFTVGEGPCVDAIHEHAPVHAADLASREAAARWPAWSGVAIDAGVRAVLALPVEAGAITAGVLNLYAATPWQPSSGQYASAQRLVDSALLILLDMAVSLSDRTKQDPPEDPPEEGAELRVLLRADVHRAAGMIMAQANVPIDQALARLRAHAFATGRTVPEVAADVIARRLRFSEEKDSAE